MLRHFSQVRIILTNHMKIETTGDEDDDLGISMYLRSQMGGHTKFLPFASIFPHYLKPFPFLSMTKVKLYLLYMDYPDRSTQSQSFSQPCERLISHPVTDEAAPGLAKLRFVQDYQTFHLQLRLVWIHRTQ